MGTPIMGAAAQVPAWVPPTDVERALFEAKTRQDWDAYLQVLFAAQTFAYAPKQLVDDDQLIAWVPHTAAHGPRFLAVYTRGELSAPRAGEVACDIALPLAPYVWWGEKLRGMVVNPGTPTEAYFPGARRKRRRWLALRDQLPQHDPDHDAGALLTKYTGPLRGPLAVGLACGAHLSVHRRALWNDLTDVYADYRADTKILREAWGAASAAQWRRQLDFLLAGQNSPPQPEFVLRVRRAIARHTAGAGASVDSTLWQRTAVETLRERGTAEAEVAEVRALIRRIIRYEARFRADGLLPADGYVGSAAGYDFGRAVSVARWGLGARYADGAEAEAAVITAGVLCRRHYTSWADFSAGYVLGRVLRFDDESFGPMYASALAPHRLLLDTPTSPWRTLPFTAPAV
ncbi:DUF1266 domain-containing protein [Streptomyces sp. HSW2009]|uniref:DUF1266 domain-containing protein n=1 Tax=Streptomyces sp. HSW2009 TaxID=3142890 RepID=UPI0032EF6533